MKKLIFLLLITQASLACYSQPGSFLDTNKLWSVLRYPYMKYPTHYTHFFKIGTDTTMNDTVFSKLLRCDEESQSNWYEYGYLREDSTGKVFYRITSNSGEGLVYDNFAMLGDTLCVAFRQNDQLRTGYNVVDSIDSVSYSGNMYKRILLVSPYTEGVSINEKWIEGIGAVSGLIYNSTSIIGGDTYYLLCFKQNDTLIFKKDSFDDCYDVINNITTIHKSKIDIYPNPSPGSMIMVLLPNSHPYQLQVSNAMGDAVIRITISGKQEYMINTGHLQPGMYILTVYGQSEPVFNEKIILY